jgi:hypothetical protein
VDDKEILLKNQQKAFFQISGAGHEAVLVAAGLQLHPGEDWIFPYYRDRALCLTLGVTPLEMFLASVGSSEDPANAGRQMPSHWGHRRFNMPSKSSCVGTQCLHAVGSAEAGRSTQSHGIEDRDTRYRPDEVTYVSIGEAAPAKGSSGNHSTRRVSASCRSSIWLKTTATRYQFPWTCRRRRRHLASRRRLPRPARLPLRRHRLPRQLPHDARAW